MREFERARMNNNSLPENPIKKLSLPCIGTVRISILSGIGITIESHEESYCVLELNDQKVDLRPVKGINPSWNQSQVLCMASFDDYLRISIFEYNKYAPCKLIGHSDLSLDFLEYYNERSTKSFEVAVGRGKVMLALQFHSL